MISLFMAASCGISGIDPVVVTAEISETVVAVLGSSFTLFIHKNAADTSSFHEGFILPTLSIISDEPYPAASVWMIKVTDSNTVVQEWTKVWQPLCGADFTDLSVNVGLC